jgi:integrase
MPPTERSAFLAYTGADRGWALEHGATGGRRTRVIPGEARRLTGTAVRGGRRSGGLRPRGPARLGPDRVRRSGPADQPIEIGAKPILLAATGRSCSTAPAPGWTATTRRLEHLAEAAGVRMPRMHPHMLRHTFVTTMLDAGVSLRDVQIAARHADPRTTMRYDRARKNLDRHPNYILAAYMASGT